LQTINPSSADLAIEVGMYTSTAAALDTKAGGGGSAMDVARNLLAGPYCRITSDAGFASTLQDLGIHAGNAGRPVGLSEPCSVSSHERLA
jgi:hypothetical protein